uniref:Matrix protein n=1 Tax=Mavingoni virus TaxID=2603829 RepID=A0A5B9BIQ2_9RHAB|nr:matrix [Mavingoni virus]
MSLWKKKKGPRSVDSTDSITKTSLWLPYAPPEDDVSEFTGYLHDVEPNTNVSGAHVKKSYFITSNLSVTSGKPITKWIEMLKILENFVDLYDGPYYSRSLFILPYIVLGMRLKPQPEVSKNTYYYKNGFEEVISFLGEEDIHLRDSKLSYSKAFRGKHQGEACLVEYKCDIKKTKRTGRDIIEVFSLPLGKQEVNIDFKELIKPYNLEIKMDSEGFNGIVNVE